MGKLSRIISYMRHYGLAATFALAYEKLVVDKRRFSPKKSRKAVQGIQPAESVICNSPLRIDDMPPAAEYIQPEGLMKDKGLRILYAVHYFYPERRGGTERFTLNLAKSALSSGDVPTVLVLDANLPVSAYTERVGNMLLREYEHEGVKCIGFRHIKAPRGLYYKNITEADPDMRALCRYLVKREGIDVVHATYPQPFAPFLAECREMGVPYAVTCTDFAAVCPYATLVDKRGELCECSEGGARCKKICKSCLCPDFDARREAARAMLEGAFLRTVPSEFVRRRLAFETGLDFLVVNHGISDDFKKQRERTEPRKILYAGTLAPLKGVHLLIDAFSETEGDFELIIAGSGEHSYEKSLRKKADERVKFVGAVPASGMPSLYSDADVVVVPSMWHETYNFVVREALSSGALVVASSLGAMPEAIDVGKCGFLFDGCSSESLKSAIKEALAFDFSKYVQKNFPTVKSEWQIYKSAYINALKAKNSEN